MGPRRRRRARAAALAALGAARARPAGWDEAPAPGRVLAPLLPPAIPRHPVVAFAPGDAPTRGGTSTPAPVAAEPASDRPGVGEPTTGPADLLSRIRAGTLWWPAIRADARCASLAIDLRGLDAAAARVLLDVADPPAGAAALVGEGPEARPRAALAARRGLVPLPGPEWLHPDALATVLAPVGGALAAFAVLGGRDGRDPSGPVDPAPWLARARFVDPWTGRPVGPDAGLDALAHLRAAAQGNPRRAVTVGFSAWKRRGAAPFLDGPAGPALHRRRPSAARATARRTGGVLVVWGADADPRAGPDDPPPLRLEDGFLRSVGLGVRHAPPTSLCLSSGAPHFSAADDTDLARLAADLAPDPALRARAARLRARILELRLTKYNLAAAGALPDAALRAGPRERLLVPGQVEGDASLRHGAPGLSTNAALLRAARAGAPEAFLLWKPHPDVVAGARRGAVDAETLALADAVAPDLPAEAALDWADRVETMTSLMGFEALLRGKAVTAHGRPFYAGWGLTDDRLPGADRGRRLTLDDLVAAALILHARHVDRRAGLPCPPERALDALAEDRAFAATRRGRLRGLWRAAVSRALTLDVAR